MAGVSTVDTSAIEFTPVKKQFVYLNSSKTTVSVYLLKSPGWQSLI